MCLCSTERGGKAHLPRTRLLSTTPGPFSSIKEEEEEEAPAAMCVCTRICLFVSVHTVGNIVGRGPEEEEEEGCASAGGRHH